jgi:long-subunit fatty acid transport protein
MENRLVYVPPLLITIFMTGILYAGSLDTVSYSRTQSRAATINSPDAAYYNPAGLVKLKDGSYLDLGNQIMTKTISHEILFSNGAEKTPSWFIPNFAYAYKQGRGALFLSLCMPEGVKFSKYTGPPGGIPLLAYAGLDLGPVQMDILRKAGLTVSTGSLELPAVNYIKASEYWLQGRLGGSISINDAFALTGGIACSYYEARRSAGLAGIGTAYSTGMSAYGWSGFFGILLTSSDKTALSVLYSTQVIARGSEHTAKINYSKIMEKRLPDYLLIGLHFISFEKTSIQISYQIDFSGEKSYGSKNIYTSGHELGYLDWLYVAVNSQALSSAPLIANGNSQNYKYRNRHIIGLGFEFDAGNLVPSIGFSYSTQERYPRAQNPLDPDLARIGIGGGLKYIASNTLVIETGAATYTYITDRMLYKSIKMNKTAWTWGAGVTLKL